MLETLRASWSLLVGIAFLMLGIGLQGSLLGLRASLEGFSTTVTGLIMSAYFGGFLVGSILTPGLVGRVGHVRVFAALASLASIAILSHVLLIQPWIWAGIRFVSGFCVAGLSIVAESWLNDSVSNRNRGQLLSVYMIVTLGGMAGGQLLLNVAEPGDFELFVIASILISLALIPMLLSATAGPAFTAPARLGLKALYRISPLGLVGCLGTGVADGAFFGMGAVYADSIGMSVAQISLFMGMAVVGGMILQWPIGALSDRYHRRSVLAAVVFLTAICALCAALLPADARWLQLALITLFGGLYLPTYSLCVAHTNDYLERDEIVAASGGLVLAFGAGACLGPLLCAGAMTWLDASGFFWFLTLVHLLLGGFALLRMHSHGATPLAEQGSALPMPPSATTYTTVLAAEESSPASGAAEKAR